MSKIERQPSAETALRQNVRVGDRLGIRLTGEGARLDLRPEIRMSETAFFKDIYIRANDGGELIRIKPDLSITHFIRLKREGEWVKSSLRNPDFYDYYPAGIARPGFPCWMDNPQGEIVIIPEYAYQTPELLTMLPESTIADEFAQIEASTAA